MKKQAKYKGKNKLVFKKRENKNEKMKKWKRKW